MNLCWIFCTVRNNKRLPRSRKNSVGWISTENWSQQRILKSWNWHWEAFEERNKRWSSAAHLELYSTDSQNPWLKTDCRDKNGRLNFPETQIYPYHNGSGLYTLPSMTKSKCFFSLKLCLPFGGALSQPVCQQSSQTTEKPGASTSTAHRIPRWTRNNAPKIAKPAFISINTLLSTATNMTWKPARRITFFFFPLGYF